MKTVKALVGENVRKSRALLRRVGTFGVTRPGHRDAGALPQGRGTAQGRGRAARVAAPCRRRGDIKILTCCPSCLQGLTRYSGDLQNGLLEADYIVVEMASRSSARTGCRTTCGGQQRRHRAGAGVSAARRPASARPCACAGGLPLCDGPAAALVRGPRGPHPRQEDFPAFYRVVWNEHVADSPTSTRAAAGCMEVVATVEEALLRHLRPAKVNLAALGNVVPHLHWHVIARFDWDSRFPQPVWAPPSGRPTGRIAAVALASAGPGRASPAAYGRRRCPRTTHPAGRFAETPLPNRSRCTASSRVLEVGFADGGRLPHPLRADARLLAVGRGAGPRPRAGGAADRQARGRRRRARAGRQLRGAAAFSDGHDTGIYSWDYLYFLGSQQDELWEVRAPAAGGRRRPRRADGPKAARRPRLRPFTTEHRCHEPDPFRLPDRRRAREGARVRGVFDSVAPSTT